MACGGGALSLWGVGRDGCGGVAVDTTTSGTASRECSLSLLKTHFDPLNSTMKPFQCVV